MYRNTPGHFSWGATIIPRKYGQPVILQRPYILGNFAAATIFPGDEISLIVTPNANKGPVPRQFKELFMYLTTS